jgi:hypothetical protein
MDGFEGVPHSAYLKLTAEKMLKLGLPYQKVSWFALLWSGAGLPLLFWFLVDLLPCCAHWDRQHKGAIGKRANARMSLKHVHGIPIFARAHSSCVLFHGST